MSDLIITESFVGLCTYCGLPTTEPHFYVDQASGVRMHAIRAIDREEGSQRCGWRYDDGYGPPSRCQKKAGHYDLHESNNVRWSHDSLLHNSIPPKLPFDE